MKKPTRMTHGKSSAGFFVVRVISLQIPLAKSWRVFHLFVVVAWRNKPPKRSHQLMVNWWFGARWFWIPGILLWIVTWVLSLELQVTSNLPIS